MDIENALLSFLAQNRDLITDNRPLRLRLDHPTGILEDVLLPQRVHGSEAICGGIEYRVLCVSLDAHLPLKELIALPAAVDIVTDTGELRTVCGIVTEASAGDSDGGLASYQLLIQDALAVMEKRTNTRVFRNMNEVDIVCTLLDEWRRTNAIIAACFEYEMDEIFKLQAYPRREFTMQYNESDAAFIRRLLKRRGICWYFCPGEREGPCHKLVLFNRNDSLPRSPAATVRFHRDAATEERDAITAWTATRKLVPVKAMRHSWDYKTANSSHFMCVQEETASSNTQSGKQLSVNLSDYQVLSPHTGESHDDLVSLGQLAMQRHDYDSKCFTGEGGVRAFRAGEYFGFEDHPEIDEHEAGDREFVLTALEIASQNNLPRELSDRVARLFSRSGWEGAATEQISSAANRTRVRFTAVRRSVEIAPAFDPRTDVPVARIQTGIVVCPENEVVHCDALARVKVRFPAARAPDHEHAGGIGASGTDADSAWIRVASNWAGQDFGTLMLPRAGTEVLVDFLGGDPDKPIIIGQLYNNPAQPPALERGSLPSGRAVSGFKSQELGGIRSNELSLDDTAGQINMRLASEHADSQLNLGFMPARGEKARGEGAELRSGKAVSVRGAGGILLTADTSQGVNNDALHREGLAAAHATALSVAGFLSKIATDVSEDPETTDSLKKLKSDTENWTSAGGSPALAMFGEAGAILGSSQSIAVAADGAIDAASREHTSISSGESLYLRATKAVSMLAYKLGIKLIAAAGDIKMQSRDGCIEIIASKRIKLIANEFIELHSPAIRTIAQGAMTEHAGGKIVQQCSATHQIRSSKFEHVGGGDGKPETVGFTSEESSHDQQVVVCDMRTNEPLRNQPYRITVEDGQILEGTTDERGLTERFATKLAFANYRIELLDNEAI
ncbi:type VI secretion system Vgr family protein [Massilia sp. SM-13]|uniref:type VI secretion system Vgr family protein n=1 Tax=Pseudoduganella rhizocola TaxID=3382643 RepID=UPI0038B51FFB